MRGDDLYHGIGLIFGVACIIISAQSPTTIARTFKVAGVILGLLGAIGIRDEHPNVFIPIIAMLFVAGIVLGVFMVLIVWNRWLKPLFSDNNDQHHTPPPRNGGSA